MKNMFSKELLKESELEKRIYNEFVDRSQFLFEIKKPYSKILDPYKESKYPLNRVGMFPRVTKKYLQNCIDISQLIKLLKTSKIKDDLYSFESESKLRDSIWNVLYDIGSDSYTTNDEWIGNDSFDQIDSRIEETTKITIAANKLLAFTTENKIKSFFENFEYKKKYAKTPYFTIFDIGPGSGNTIVPLIELIHSLSNQGHVPKNYQDHIHVMLIDGDVRSLNKTKNLLRNGKTFNSLKYVDYIRANFGRLHLNPHLDSFQNRVDLIVSGAAIMHNTNKTQFFKSLYSILKPDGTMCIWDWYCGPTFAAPYLKLGENNTIVNTDTDSFIFEPTQEFTEEFYRLSENTLKKRIIYEVTLEEAEETEANFQAWLGLWGYIDRNKSTGKLIERYVDGLPVSKYLNKLFWAKIKTEDGFNYIKDFLIKTIIKKDIQPFGSKTAYYFIEGYGENYSELMKESGFFEPRDISFDSVYGDFRQMIPSIEMEHLGKAIKFSFGDKKT